MANRVLNVDYAQMGKLAQALDDAGRRSSELWMQILADVEELGQGPKPWKGPNHDAFVAYFEGNSHVGWYAGDDMRANWLGLNGYWVQKCADHYKWLEEQLDAKMKEMLKES